MAKAALTHIVENQGPLDKRDNDHAIEISLKRPLYHGIEQLDHLGVTSLQPQGKCANGIEQQCAEDVALL